MANDYNALTPLNQPKPTVRARVTGAAAGAVVGAITPLGPLGTIAGAVLGGIYGPRSKVVNKGADKAVEQIGKWAGR